MIRLLYHAIFQIQQIGLSIQISYWHQSIRLFIILLKVDAKKMVWKQGKNLKCNFMFILFYFNYYFY